MNKEMMLEAVKEAYVGIKNHHGGPFGCVIEKNGKIVGRGHNSVLKKNDPTCHGEMEAIRDACANLGTRDLTGCELYTTAEPCPMCLGGILWANIGKVYYGCDRKDTDGIGFRDDVFYDFMDGKSDILSVLPMDKTECKQLFEDYVKDSASERY